ncbi:hypothetical protein MTR_2g093785 [Medicago truncatula]|nr:hypothetical protein MTR_2g093785 [Medicago truncatula]
MKKSNTNLGARSKDYSEKYKIKQRIYRIELLGANLEKQVRKTVHPTSPLGPRTLTEKKKFIKLLVAPYKISTRLKKDLLQLE